MKTRIWALLVVSVAFALAGCKPQDAATTTGAGQPSNAPPTSAGTTTPPMSAASPASR
jgi:hypothetical protein